MANPATKLVPLFKQQSMMQSLAGEAGEGLGSEPGGGRWCSAGTFCLSVKEALGVQRGEGAGPQSHSFSCTFLEGEVSRRLEAQSGVGRKGGWQVGKHTPGRKDLETNQCFSKLLAGEKTKGSERGLIFWELKA